MKNGGRRAGAARLWLIFHSSFFILHSAAPAVTTSTPPARPEPAPVTTRDFFNLATRQLRTNQLREAEAGFVGVLAQQDAQWQPAALYNLGHVRFRQGVEALKKSPEPNAARVRATGAARLGDEALRNADAALAGNDLRQMIAAYRDGRGVRRDLREAEKAVRQAFEAHAATLLKWQRALGDFAGAAELNPADTNAAHNAEITRRHIAKLVDQLRQLQQMLGGAGGKSQQLKEKLDALKGRIPADQMPPGAAGDEEEDDEELPNGPRPGMEEGPQREGQEQAPMSREDAGRMLDSFRLDGDRRLPMGGDKEGTPKDRNRPNW